MSLRRSRSNRSPAEAVAPPSPGSSDGRPMTPLSAKTNQQLPPKHRHRDYSCYIHVINKTGLKLHLVDSKHVSGTWAPGSPPTHIEPDIDTLIELTDPKGPAGSEGWCSYRLYHPKKTSAISFQLRFADPYWAKDDNYLHATTQYPQWISLNVLNYQTNGHPFIAYVEVNLLQHKLSEQRPSHQYADETTSEPSTPSDQSKGISRRSSSEVFPGSPSSQKSSSISQEPLANKAPEPINSNGSFSAHSKKDSAIVLIEEVENAANQGLGTDLPLDRPNEGIRNSESEVSQALLDAESPPPQDEANDDLKPIEIPINGPDSSEDQPTTTGEVANIGGLPTVRESPGLEEQYQPANSSIDKNSEQVVTAPKVDGASATYSPRQIDLVHTVEQLHEPEEQPQTHADREISPVHDSSAIQDLKTKDEAEETESSQHVLTQQDEVSPSADDTVEDEQLPIVEDTVAQKDLPKARNLSTREDSGEAGNSVQDEEPLVPDSLSEVKVLPAVGETGEGDQPQQIAQPPASEDFSPKDSSPVEEQVETEQKFDDAKPATNIEPGQSQMPATAQAEEGHETEVLPTIENPSVLKVVPKPEDADESEILAASQGTAAIEDLTVSTGFVEQEGSNAAKSSGAEQNLPDSGESTKTKDIANIEASTQVEVPTIIEETTAVPESAKVEDQVEESSSIGESLQERPLMEVEELPGTHIVMSEKETIKATEPTARGISAQTGEMIAQDRQVKQMVDQATQTDDVIIGNIEQEYIIVSKDDIEEDIPSSSATSPLLPEQDRSTAIQPEESPSPATSNWSILDSQTTKIGIAALVFLGFYIPTAMKVSRGIAIAMNQSRF